MASQQRLIDSGLVIVTFQKGGRGQLEKISVTSLIFAQEHQVVGPVCIRRAVKAARGGHIDFAAQNRLEPPLQRSLVELHCPKEVSVVRYGDGRHLEPSRAIHQAVNFTSAVEQAVIGMEVKMDEVFGWHAATILTERGWLWHAYAHPGQRFRKHRNLAVRLMIGGCFAGFWRHRGRVSYGRSQLEDTEKGLWVWVRKGGYSAPGGGAGTQIGSRS